MLKNILKVLSSNALLAIVGLISSFIFPIIFSIEGYAYYQEYLLYLSYINICHLGIASGMFLNYAGKNYYSIDKGQYKSEINLITIVLFAFTIIGTLLFAITKNELILLTAVSIFPQCIIASYLSLYQAWNKFTLYSVLNALPRVTFVAILFIIWALNKSISGNSAVVLYVLVLWAIASYCYIDYLIFTKGVKSYRIFSPTNRETTFSGFLIMLGNYINILFHTIDKQFVKIFYSTESFAKYSFAMSLQNIMMIFITALSQPFYPRLAKGDIDKTYIGKLKELLFMFGAYSGCAFFAVSFVVRRCIGQYEDSLKVIAMFFAVFPAMAIINVLYINLYKLKRMLKKYNLALACMVLVAVLFNFVAVFLQGDYVGISLATVVSYYVWLLYSQRDFEELSLTLKDTVYLIGFFLCYFSIINIIHNEIIGFVVYGALISIWNIIMYKRTISESINIVRGRVIK